jgi:geranylgeranyl reductase family protein
LQKGSEQELVKIYDLIVCGAGPAGATAAAIAARAGLKVALVEKCSLPRHKTCGGGMPMVIQDFLLDLAPEAFLESDVLYIRHTWNFDDPYLAPINPQATDQKLSIWMVQRPIFDNALVQSAVRAGAELVDGLTMRSVSIEDNRVKVCAQVTASADRGNRVEFQAFARHMIGADGANGISARAAGLRRSRAIALGMEVEFPYDWTDRHPDLRPDVAHLEYGAVPWGYAWIFPKAEHLNIGAGVFHTRGGDVRGDRRVREQIRQAIVGYLDSFQLDYDLDALRFRAHPLPVWNGREPLHTSDGRILLAGDAAGLINPFFGDGILHAVKSGIIAAECVIEGTVLEYSDRIHAEFASSFDAARRLAQVFYRFPQFCYRYGVKHPKATRAAAQLLAGERPFNGVFQRTLRHMGQALVSSLGH